MTARPWILNCNTQRQPTGRNTDQSPRGIRERQANCDVAAASNAGFLKRHRQVSSTYLYTGLGTDFCLPLLNAVADKILFRSIMEGAGFSNLELWRPSKQVATQLDCSTISDTQLLAEWLREPPSFPLYSSSQSAELAT
jgi:hypothetical protein